ncbi:EAL domain-containing protein [Pseudohongiella sp. O18]|uniref:EAL domain-containing protein n=1 Tax=Pseudohongiella sp. O18 TaxID=2904248 RepID=UPI001F215050|nr:EAL domain-containing protein [Pseudohongiella sp. O18]
MKIKNTGAIWLLPAIVAFIAPVVAGFWYARDEAVDQQNAALASAAGTVLARAEDVAYQFRAATEGLVPFATEPCGDEALRAMRLSSLSFRYVQSALYIEGDSLRCSSVEVHSPAFDLGESTGRNFRGAEIWIDEQLPWAVASAPLMILKQPSGFGVALNADDIFYGFEPAGTALVVLEFTENGPAPLAEFGDIQPDLAMIEYVSGQGSGTYPYNEYVLHYKASEEDLTIGVLVMALRSAANASVLQQIYRVLPFAIVGGAVLAGLATQLFFRRRSFRKDIEAGIRLREFYLEYQPIMDIQQQRCIGAEALLRWRRNGERIQPDVFIPLAEREGVIHAITDEVLRLIARDMSSFLQQTDDFYVSINISGYDLADPKLPDRLSRLLESSGADASRFLVEITESSFVDRLTTREAIQALRRMGFQIAIDDFGTGFSNFAYLQLYDIDYLKIDRLFVETIAQDEVKTQLVFHLIELANKLNVEVIAEGVEQQIQADVLREKGVCCAQGWLYSKPVRSRRLIAQLQGEQPASG